MTLAFEHFQFVKKKKMCRIQWMPLVGLVESDIILVEWRHRPYTSRLY